MAAAEKPWLQALLASKKTCVVQDGRRKVHYVLPDGKEMVEEYDMANGKLLVRKIKTKPRLGGEGKWEFEIGEEYSRLASMHREPEALVESGSNPLFTRVDTVTAFQWRIRNLPYPLENYKVTVDDSRDGITIRTVNKKYYKRFTIPDMQRCGLPLEQASLTIAHANNTLIVTYKKPKGIVEMEKSIQMELKKLKAEKEGDVECNQS